MHRKTLIRSAAAAATVVALAIGGFTGAGSASAADAPNIQPFAKFDKVSLIGSRGAVTSYSLEQTSKGSTWSLQIQDGTNKHNWKWDALNGYRSSYKVSSDSKSNAVRKAVADGYTRKDVVPVPDLEIIAIEAAGNEGFVREGRLAVNSKSLALEWTMIVEQGKNDPKVVIDVETQAVISVK